MKTLISMIGLIAFCLSPIYAQVTIDQIDWSTYPDGRISGTSQNGVTWFGDYDDQDGTGFFGVRNGLFIIDDTEGLTNCDCTDSGDPNCGALDNTLTLGPFSFEDYCEVNVKFDITPRGTLLCGAADDQDPDDAEHSICGGDLGDEWLMTDMLEIRVINFETGEERITKLCGTESNSGSFSIDETFDFSGPSGAIAVMITGGTQNGGSYDLGNVVFEGVERLNTSLDLRVISNNDDRTICQGEGQIVLGTSADPSSDYVWIFPNGSTVSGNVSNGRHHLVLSNISPAESGTYGVRVTDANNCTLEEEISIVVYRNDHSECQSRVEFGNLFGGAQNALCSNILLPEVDDNGITGVWSPARDLSLYAGQIATFTFTPDDSNIPEDSFTFKIQDVSTINSVASVPDGIPILCNATDTTYDLLEMFKMNTDEFRLSITGDLDLFDWTPPAGQAYNEAFEDEYRNFSVFQKTPRRSSVFTLEAVPECGGDVILKSFYIHVIGEVAPIVIDTAICAGDFVEFGNFKLFKDTVIVAQTACDTALMASIDIIEPVERNDPFYTFLGCGGAVYYYDTIVNNKHVGFVTGPIDVPPYGPNYDTILIKSGSDHINFHYTLPMPAVSTGCDSLIEVFITGNDNLVEEIHFDLCANQDTMIEVFGQEYLIDRITPYLLIPGGSDGCHTIIVDANILPAMEDTLTMTTHCASEVVNLEIARGVFRDFTSDMSYPMTIPVDVGANGCPATVFVDLEFIEPTRGELDMRLCPGESLTIGDRTFISNVVGEEVTLVGGAASGCDSIVTVSIEYIFADAFPVSEVICEEATYELEGEVFDFNRPSGIVRVPSVLGCDSVIYNVSLDFHDAPDITIDTTLCPGDQIELPEYNYTITDALLTDDIVHTNADGCHQNILIRAAIKEPVRTEFEETICYGETYAFDGQDFAVTGEYEEIHTAASGCDSISTLKLTVLPEIEVTDIGDFSTCPESPIDMYGTLYNETGSYTVTLTSTTTGCDSIIQFRLFADEIPETNLGILTTCPAVPLELYNNIYDEEGQYIVNLVTADGCDSTITFELQFDEVIHTDIGPLMTCPAVPLEAFGNTYPEEGDYSVTLQTEKGCDSIVMFQVVFEEIPQTDIGVQMTCPAVPLELYGNSYSAEGDYSVTIQSTDGCDSIINFEVVFEEIPETDIGILTTCPAVPLEAYGNQYPTEGSYSVTLRTNDGCDSIVNFEVVFDAIPQTDIGVYTTCPNVPLELHGETFYDEGDHSVIVQTDAGCDSILNFQLEYELVPETDAGVFTTCPDTPLDYLGKQWPTEGRFTERLRTAEGCDSLVTFEVVFFESYDIQLGDQVTCAELPFTLDGVEYDEGQHILDLRTADGCDSTITFTVIHEASPEQMINEVICFGETYDLFGVIYSSSVDLIITEPYGASNGCDSIVHLILTVNDLPETFENHQICQGESVTVGETEFTESVTFATVIFQDQYQCDSLVHVTVDVLSPGLNDMGDQQVCGTDNLDIGGNTVSDEGPHTIVLPGLAANGCDSIVTLNLTRVIAYTEDLSETICAGESIEFFGQTLTTTGIVTHTYEVGGCDSTITMDLTVLPAVPDMILPIDICFGESYEHDGEVYTASGSYERKYDSVDGCDSLVIIQLTVADQVTSDRTHDMCAGETYNYGGQTFSQAGEYEVNFARPGSCDSTVHLTIVLHDVYDQNIGIVPICTGGVYTIGGNTYDTEGQYTAQLKSQSGCDSIVHFELQILDEIIVDLGVVNLCPGETHRFDNQDIDVAGVYQTMEVSQHGCDSITTIEIQYSNVGEVVIEDVIGSCEGGANGAFTIVEWPGALPSFILSGANESIPLDGLPITFEGLASGVYSYEIFDANGCVETFDVSIGDGREQSITIHIDTINVGDGEYVLSLDYAGVLSSITWDEAEGLSCYDCPDPEVKISERTTFVVTVVDEDGCMSTTGITIDVTLEHEVYLPNVINTNSSTGNHRFYPSVEGDGQGLLFDMHIYDRWGNLMYEEKGGSVNDRSSGWNGRMNGIRINNGVYVYIVRIYNTQGLSKVLAGDITLLL